MPSTSRPSDVSPPTDGVRREAAGPVRSLVRHRQPGPVRRGGAAPGRRQRRRIVAALDAAAAIPVRIVHRPVRHARPRASPPPVARRTPATRCVGVIAWMHTFSPARMWIAGLQALQQAAPPPAHPVQPRSALGRDRHGLHEPPPGGPRRPRVRVHREPAAGRPQDRRRALAGPVRRRPDRRLGAGGLRLARGPTPAHRPFRRQHAPCRRHRGRQGRGPDPARRRRQWLRRSAIWPRPCAAAPGRRRRRARWTPTTTQYDAGARARPGGARRAELREAARIEVGLRDVPDGRRLRRVHRHLRGPRRAPPAARASPPQRLMADGYGFGAEGDWKSAVLVRLVKVMATGLPGGTSFMEDYTYDLDPAGPKVLGAHMLEVCPTIAAARPTLRDPSAVDRRPGRPGPARLRRRPRAGRSSPA